MCRIYNTIGCLNAIQSHLVKNNLDEFNSLDELINFQKDYHFKEQQVLVDHRLLIQKEKITLEEDISELKYASYTRKCELEQQLRQKLSGFNQQIESLFVADSNIISIIIDYYKNTIIWIKIWLTPLIFQLKIILLERQSNKILLKNNNRLQYIDTNFDEAVNQSSFLNIETLQLKRTVIKEINSSIYGAIGEQKVVNVLENLPDDYVLINDFSCYFQPPIYNRKENDYIKSVQIDHLLISPSGIFLIETKNWSEHSISNINLRSPVQQVKRTNFALYRIITSEMKKSIFNFTKHHWGDRKVPIRNLIVFINNKPTEEFQFVKILGLNELLGYVKYFTPCLSSKETQTIADFLLKMSSRKEITSKLTI